MAMHLEQARKIVGNWRKNGFKAGKALLELGYSPSVANKKSGEVINRALRVIAKVEAKEIMESPNPSRTLLGYVGMTSNELRDEYVYIIRQNKDMSNKLKALTPLLAELGIRWGDEKQIIQPVLNLTVTEKR